MSQFSEAATKTAVPGAAMGQYLRVKKVSGKLQLAGTGASDGPVEVGTIEEETFGDSNPPTVMYRLRNATGTRKAVAAGAIGADALFYGAAGGKISATASGDPLGVTVEAASANNDIIEVMYY